MGGKFLKVTMMGALAAALILFMAAGAAGALQTTSGSEVFSRIDGSTFTYMSGVGGWATEVVVSGDGGFTGYFIDWDMGDTGEGYPEGTRYECRFSGSFALTGQVDAYTYALRLVALDIQTDTGAERIIDGVKVIDTDAYGLEGGEVFMLYCPGRETADLPEGFLEWICMPNAWDMAPDLLPFYGLYNVEEGTGFYAEFVKDMPDSNGTPTDPQAYAGLWHASPVVGSGFSERLALNEDSTFLWAAGQMDGLERVRFRSGTWAADKGSLWLTVEEEVRWEGGREVPASGSMGTKTEIQDAQAVASTLVVPTVEEYEVSPVEAEKDAGIPQSRTITIEGVQYWELAHPMDLEALYADFADLKEQAVQTVGTGADFLQRLSGSQWLGDESEYALEVGAICLFRADEKESIPFRWRYHISDESVIGFFYSEYEISPESRPIPGGDVGWRRFYFEALRPGECELTFRYGRYGDEWDDEWEEEYRCTLVIASE